MTIFYDTHAHLDFPDFADDLPQVVERAHAAGIAKIITIGTDLASSERALTLSEKFPNVFAAVGWHPSHASEAPPEFDRAALGGQVDFLMHYKDSPEPTPPGMVPPGWENKVMHATFLIGGTTLMAADLSEAGPSFAGFALSLAVPTEAEADRAFAALADGGQVRMPLTKTFWSSPFGMLADRFGIGWVVSGVA